MKRMVLAGVLMAVAAPPCVGQSAEREYLALRAKYERELTATVERKEPWNSADSAALRDLESRIRPIIGSFASSLVDGQGQFNVATLVPGYADSFLADGWQYQSADKKTRMLVTTKALLMGWMKHGTVNEMRVSLDDPAMLTHLFEVNAAVVRYADITLSEGARLGLVSAMLSNREQDYCNCTPGQLFVSFERGTRVFVVEAPVRVEIPAAAECVAAWNEGEVRNKVLMDSASKLGTSSLNQQISDSYEQRVAEYKRCYGEHVVTDPRFATIVQQVRDIAAALPQR